jgi:hypothetical protein
MSNLAMAVEFRLQHLIRDFWAYGGETLMVENIDLKGVDNRP